MSEYDGFLHELFLSYQGEGPWIGKRQLFIRMAGCSRKCAYCDTRDSWEHTPASWKFHHPSGRYSLKKNPVTPDLLVAVIRQMIQKQGMIDSFAITGGEPLEQSAFLGAILNKLRKNFKKIPILLETNGLEDVVDEKTFAGIDFFSFDFKLRSTTGHMAELAPLKRNLRRLKGRNGCVKVVVQPRSRAAELAEVAKVIHQYQPDWPLILQPMTIPQSQHSRLFKKCDTIIQNLHHIHPEIRLIPQMHRYFDIK